MGSASKRVAAAAVVWWILWQKCVFLRRVLDHYITRFVLVLHPNIWDSSTPGTVNRWRRRLAAAILIQSSAGSCSPFAHWRWPNAHLRQYSPCSEFCVNILYSFSFINYGCCVMFVYMCNMFWVLSQLITSYRVAICGIILWITDNFCFTSGVSAFLITVSFFICSESFI